jgi:hypothetical protein
MRFSRLKLPQAAPITDMINILIRKVTMRGNAFPITQDGTFFEKERFIT